MLIPRPVISLESLLLWNVIAVIGLWHLLRILITELARILFNHPP
jgi:hypothetical protein